MSDLNQFVDEVVENVERVIVGKRSAIELILIALLCDGHVLIEDAPGTGKTMLARSIALSLGLSFKRVQCTPDLLPNDITGVSVFNQKTGDFDFRPGPVFANVLLADEINRANPRTQSALLEAMAESQVTVDGTTRGLKQPFIVLATQNPIEYEGTYPLPESQLDRFLIRLSIGYPGREEEDQLLMNLKLDHPIHELEQVVDPGRIPSLQRSVREIYFDETVREYLLSIVWATRDHPDLALGASPRGALGLFRAAQGRAAMESRDFVTPDDVKSLAIPCLAHRLIVRPEGSVGGRTAEAVLEDVLQSVRVPVRES